jgi:hypothetical protein
MDEIIDKEIEMNFEFCMGSFSFKILFVFFSPGCLIVTRNASSKFARSKIHE